MWEILFTFSFIFLAALPGRTTFILMLLGASDHPWRIVLGAVPAFALQCGLAVIVGQALKEFPQVYVHAVAGALFLYFAVQFWRESRHSEKLAEVGAKRSIASIFLLFFLSEFGDVSQLAIASRAAQVGSPFAVFCGSLGAMTLIVVLAVFAGRGLGTKIKPARLQKAAAIAFFLLGLYLLVSSVLHF